MRPDRLAGGRADNKQPGDFDREALLKGIKIEMEHTDDPDIALEIAMDHLAEFSSYYDEQVGLPKMERELSSSQDSPKSYVGSLDGEEEMDKQNTFDDLDDSLDKAVYDSKEDTDELEEGLGDQDNIVPVSVTLNFPHNNRLDGVLRVNKNGNVFSVSPDRITQSLASKVSNLSNRLRLDVAPIDLFKKIERSLNRGNFDGSARSDDGQVKFNWLLRGVWMNEAEDLDLDIKDSDIKKALADLDAPEEEDEKDYVDLGTEDIKLVDQYEVTINNIIDRVKKTNKNWQEAPFWREVSKQLLDTTNGKCFLDQGTLKQNFWTYAKESGAVSGDLDDFEIEEKPFEPRPRYSFSDDELDEAEIKDQPLYKTRPDAFGDSARKRYGLTRLQRFQDRNKFAPGEGFPSDEDADRDFSYGESIRARSNKAAESNEGKKNFKKR